MPPRGSRNLFDEEAIRAHAIPVDSAFRQRSEAAGVRASTVGEVVLTPWAWKSASARAAADGLLVAVGAGGGILHLGGRERISRYDLGALVAGMLGADASPRDRRGNASERWARPTPDVSLDSSRAHALGYDPLPLREEFRVLLADLALSA